jgi:hypothetical protein
MWVCGEVDGTETLLSVRSPALGSPLCATMNDEPQHLCSEIERLEIAIDRTRGGNDDETMLHRRHTLQHELEVALLQQAELEEIERMEATIKRAVETKFVENPSVLRSIGECPLCMEEKQEYGWSNENEEGRYWCCGATC